jgi:NAD(P)-dependent dehydrogenase (short-subunit alcohol dehydrogenase family)
MVHRRGLEMKNTVAVFLALYLAASIANADDPAPAPLKAVLVTGASTGIGRKITERLAADGYFVYGGARKDKDIAELSALKNVRGVRLDVTKPEDIAAAVESITKDGRGLYGLVNNAGVAIVGPLVETEESDFHFLMDVNLFGPYRVTRAFGPLIIKEKGRIVMIGSISGILARPLLGVYSMSKHGVEAYTDALAEELAPIGVGVSVVEPGNYRSDIASNMVKHLGDSPADKKITGRLGTVDRSEYKEPDEVADAVKRALADAKPQRRYMVVPNQREAEITIRKQIEQLVQLNQNQPYSYSREALIAMLDAALADSKATR